MTTPAAAPTAALPRAAWRQDPALAAAFVSVVLLTAFLLAPQPIPAVTPPSLTLVVADLRGQALVVTDTADPSRARTIPLPGGPHEMLALPDGRLVVSLEQYGSLAIVDVPRGEVQSLHVGGVPHGLALVGDTLYVTDRAVNAIRRFTIGTWVEREPVASGGWPHIVAPLPDGRLAIANAADDTLTLGARVVEVSHVPESIAVALDGRVATAGSVGGMLHVFDDAGRPLAQYDLGGRPVRLLYDPRGEILAAALSADASVALVDRGAVRRIVVGGVPDGLAFSSDGHWLYVSDMAGGMVSVVDVQHSRVAQRFRAGRTAGALLVLPHG